MAMRYLIHISIDSLAEWKRECDFRLVEPTLWRGQQISTTSLASALFRIEIRHKRFQRLRKSLPLRPTGLMIPWSFAKVKEQP